jgi:uncharacterized damage-inducible protein DinB
MDFKQHFLYQTDYQHWANDILFNALDRLDDEARKSTQKLYFGSLHNSVDHLAFFHRKWLARLRSEDNNLRYTDTIHHDWRELKNILRKDLREMQDWLARQPQAFFDTQLRYRRTLDQEKHSVWVRDALTHIFTFAAMERGRISALAANMGAPLADMFYASYRQEMGEHLDNLRKADTSAS